MDRDVALSVLTAVTAIKTAVQTIATNTSPDEPVGLSSPSPVRSNDESEEPEGQEEQEEPKDLEEPVTKTTTRKK